MTVVQAIHELQLIARTFKSLMKLEEALKVAAELELRESALKQSLASMEVEEKDYNKLLDETDKQLEELVGRVSEQKALAETIVTEARKVATGITDEAKKEADKMIKATQANLQEVTQSIANKQAELGELSKEFNKTKNQFEDFKRNIEQDKKRIINSLGGL